MRDRTRVVHGCYRPELWHGSVAPPTVSSTVYRLEGIGPASLPEGYEYSRVGNPNREWLEKDLAKLENGASAHLFSSGCAAIAAVVQSISPKSRIFADRRVYGGTHRLFQRFAPSWGREVVWHDLLSNGEMPKALGRGDLLWIETPTNPTLKIWDIVRIGEEAKRRGALLVVDNTFATFLLQKPLELGASIVVHSTSKYINGHSDVLGGAVVVGPAELSPVFFDLQMAVGAVLSPSDSQLTQRGLKTLALRMERHCTNAMRIAGFLRDHPRVSRVFYPGLREHPDHALARRQMKAFGGVVACEVKGGQTEALAFLNRLSLFQHTASLGGVESLACHPATSSHLSVPEHQRESQGIATNLIRLSVGIEDSEDLIDDLHAALAGD